MVTLARYLRDLPPNEGCRWKKDLKNYPLGVAVETQLLIVFIEEHFIQSFIQSKYKQWTSFQAIYTRATLICIDLSLSILSIQNIVKGTWQTLFVVEFVCFYFLQSDSSVCSVIRGIRKRHPFSYAAQLTWIDQWLIHSAAWHVSYPFTPSYFKRWNWISCVYFERILFMRRFFSNRRRTADVHVY